MPSAPVDARAADRPAGASAPQRVVAAGTGRMGRSMAVAFAIAGWPVTLLDLKVRDQDGERAQEGSARAEIDAHLGSLVRVGLLDGAGHARAAARVEYCPEREAGTALAGARIVLEGVPERLEDKRAAFARLEAHAARDAVIASTTSSFLSSDLAGFLRRPERFLNAHWLNPAYLIPLVEVSPHAGTSVAARESLVGALESIGKAPVLCAPRPGYIVPRLQALVMNEAARLVEEGVASAEDVDRAVRLGFGLRYASMGVLEFVDVGGLDILYYASRYMSQTVSAERYEVPPLIERMMSEGRTGLRSGAGFYDWSQIDPDRFRDALMARLVALLRHEGRLPRVAGDAGESGDAAGGAP